MGALKGQLRGYSSKSLRADQVLHCLRCGVPARRPAHVCEQNQHRERKKKEKNERERERAPNTGFILCAGCLPVTRGATSSEDLGVPKKILPGYPRAFGRPRT